MNLLVIVVILMLFVGMSIGCVKGLLRSFMGAIATVLAIIIAYLITPLVSQALINNTTIDDAIEAKVYRTIEAEVRERAEKEINKQLEAYGQDGDYQLTQAELNAIMAEKVSKTDQINMINGLSLPSFVKTTLIENNNNDIYRKMNVGSIYSYISKSIAYSCMNAIATVASIILVKLILSLIILALNAVVNRIPIVSWVNRAGGAILGLVTALLVVWLLLIFVSVFLGDTGRHMINESSLLTFINSKNVFVAMISNITDILF